MSIPKIIHISWKNKNILQDDSIFMQFCVKRLMELNTDWEIQISDDDDVDSYLQEHLDTIDYSLLKNKSIVEKLDVWRLIKLYINGGLYTDIDRAYDTPINFIINENIKCVLPTCLDHDFTHDFMLSSAGNPIYATTLNLNLQRRRGGHTNIYFLGPQTYMHAITQCLVGYIINTDPGKDVFCQLRAIIENSKFITTYREEPPVKTVLYRNSTISQNEFETMKREFYRNNQLTHWTGEW